MIFMSVISVVLFLALKIMQTELSQLASALALIYANAYLDLPFLFWVLLYQIYKSITAMF
jgi:hypothetical protein